MTIDHIIDQKIAAVRQVAGWIQPESESVLRTLFEQLYRKDPSTSQASYDFTGASVAMGLQFPNQYVIFTESWEMQAGERRYIVQILRVDSDWEEIRSFRRQLPEDVRSDACVEVMPARDLIPAVVQGVAFSIPG